jgi:hypothetical protein
MRSGPLVVNDVYGLYRRTFVCSFALILNSFLLITSFPGYSLWFEHSVAHTYPTFLNFLLDRMTVFLKATLLFRFFAGNRLQWRKSVLLGCPHPLLINFGIVLKVGHYRFPFLSSSSTKCSCVRNLSDSLLSVCFVACTPSITDCHIFHYNDNCSWQLNILKCVGCRRVVSRPWCVGFKFVQRPISFRKTSSGSWL